MRNDPISIRIPDDELDACDRLAVVLKVTRSVLVRAALTELVVRADLNQIRERVGTLPNTRQGAPRRGLSMTKPSPRKSEGPAETGPFAEDLLGREEVAPA